VPLDQLARLLVTPDAHLITLRGEFWGYVLPSKVHGCIESRLPILYIGPEASDVFLLCRSAGVPFGHVLNGDAAGVQNALEALGRMAP